MPNLMKDGYALIDNAVAPETVQTAFTTFGQQYLDTEENLAARSKQDGGARSVLLVGDKRFMMTVELSGAFASRDLYANTSILSEVDGALGPDFVLDSMGVVLALPGAADQHVHRDGALFGQLDAMLPAYALTVVIPLVDMNDETGQTMIWPKTHRSAMTSETAKSHHTADSISNDVLVGSSVVWDYRLLHGGRGNVSRIPRPILFLTYCRPWFRDVQNFHNKNRLLLGDGFLETVPEAHKFLFRFAS